jgi:phage gp29-like protein
MVLSGRMVLPSPDEGAPPLLTLQFDPQAALAQDPNQAALRSVTLSFDVPQTSAHQQPFTRWQALAQALAQSMDAFILDDHGQSLSAEGYEAIGAQLSLLYDALDARELSAGSMAVRRLFS